MAPTATKVEPIVQELAFERETKGTRVYSFENADGRKITQYVLKRDAAALGNPDAIRVTIEAA
jgi:hypothetical protein